MAAQTCICVTRFRLARRRVCCVLRYLWKWETDEWSSITGGDDFDGHDLQWAYADNAVWAIGGGKRTVGEYGAADGACWLHEDVHHTGDVNHLQLVEATVCWETLF